MRLATVADGFLHGFVAVITLQFSEGNPHVPLDGGRILRNSGCQHPGAMSDPETDVDGVADVWTTLAVS